MLKTTIFRKILDGDLRKIAEMSRKIDQHEVLREKHWFSASERLWSRIRGNSDLKLKNRDFWTENRPDRSKSSKVNSFFTQSLRVGVQNHAQICDFSENPRWGPYKNRKNVTKNLSARGTSWKTLIFSFWTASITYTRRFAPEAEKCWFLNQKSSGSMKFDLCRSYTPPGCGAIRFRFAMLLKTVLTYTLNGFDHVHEAIRTGS